MNQITPAILAHTQELSTSAIVEVFIIDVSKMMGSSWGDENYMLRISNSLNERGQPVVWQGFEYIFVPIACEGFGVGSEGPAKRPTLTISNVLGLATGMINDYKGLVGARVTRKSTYVKFLDAVNFKSLENPDADPNSGFYDDVYYIERKVAEDDTVISFELSSPIDLEGVRLPGNIIVSDICTFEYRKDGCDYSGPPVATVENVPTNIREKDRCNKQLSGCRLRFKDEPLRISCFISVGNGT